MAETNNYPSNYLSDYLRAGLPHLQTHCNKLLTLRRHYAAALAEHPELIERSRIANYRLGCVIVYADNNAVATKLNQLNNTLQHALGKHVPELNKIRVLVQPTKSRQL